MDAFKILDALDDGVFSVAQAANIGVSSRQLRREVDAGRIVRLARGWYASADRMKGGEEKRHRLRTRGLLARLGDGFFATHHSALLAYNLPLLAPDLGVVHVGSRTLKRSASTPTHALHVLPQAAQLGDATPRSVAAAVAAVQVGLTQTPRAALVVADEALRRSRADLTRSDAQSGSCTREDLTAAVAAHRRSRGIGAVGAILRLADPRSESPGETLLRYAVHLLGIEVEPQFEIKIGNGTYRADFRVKDTKMLLEFDGLIKLDDPHERRRADERERALRRAGWIIVRFTWPELDNLTLIKERIAQAVKDHAAWQEPA